MNLFLLDTPQLLRHVGGEASQDDVTQVLYERLADVHEQFQDVKNILEKFDLFVESSLEQSIQEMLDEKQDEIDDLQDKNSELQKKNDQLEYQLLNVPSETLN